MIRMKLSRTFSVVLGLAAALSQGCGGDSSSGPSGGSGGSGGGDPGNSNTASGPSSCSPTHCTNDPQYSVFSEDYCALMKMDADGKDAQCGKEFLAKNTCSLAHDKCNASNGQDYDVVMAACMAEFTAWQNCVAMHK